jgi:mutator protein MutT
MKERTLLFLYKPTEKQILLAMKKRGFGEGKWNGVGGKIEEGESVEQATAREAKEEIGVEVAVTDLRKVATIDFSFDGKIEFNQRVHAYFVERWVGEPTESEEMRPEWYATDAIPYDAMWVDDQYWLPRVLAGECLTASFTFSTDGTRVLDMQIEALGQV